MNGAELYGKVLRVQLARPGKYQEIATRAVWDEEEFIKQKSENLQIINSAAAEVEASVLEGQSARKKVKTSFKELHQNPRVFLVF